MKTRIILLASIVMLSFACKHSKNTEKTTSTTTTTTTAVKYRVIVSFGSKGNGTDSQTLAALDSYIKSFNTKEKTNVAYEKVAFGKEGEFDCCFSLTDLSNKKQDEFVTGIKNVTKSGKSVFVNENSVCAHKK